MKNLLVLIGLACLILGGYSLYQGIVEVTKAPISEDAGREYTGRTKRSYDREGREVRSYEYRATGDRGPSALTTKEGKTGAFFIFAGALFVIGASVLKT